MLARKSTRRRVRGQCDEAYIWRCPNPMALDGAPNDGGDRFVDRDVEAKRKDLGARRRRRPRIQAPTGFDGNARRAERPAPPSGDLVGGNLMPRARHRPVGQPELTLCCCSNSYR